MKYNENKIIVCPKCGRKIKNYPDERYALRESVYGGKDKICAYCQYDELRQHYISLAKRLDELNLQSYLTDKKLWKIIDGIVLQAPEPPKQLDGHGELEKTYFTLISWNYSNSDDETLNTFEAAAKKVYNLSQFYVSEEITGIETENYSAIIYRMNLDSKFIVNNNGNNPYVHYNLQKEIFDNLTNPKTINEYKYKIKSCWVLAEYEEDNNYLIKADEYKNRLKDKFNIVYEEIEDDIEDIIMEKCLKKCDKVLTRIQTASNEDEKSSTFRDYFDLLQELNSGIIDLDGDKKNIGKIPYRGSCVQEEIMNNMDIIFGYEIAYANFEYWIRVQDNDYLCKSLWYLDNWTKFLFGFTHKESDFDEIYEDEYLNLLNNIINNFITFLIENVNKIDDISIGELYINQYKRKNPRIPLMLPIDCDKSEYTLSKESLALIAVNMIEPYILLKRIIILIKNRDENKEIINRLKLNLYKQEYTLFSIFYDDKNNPNFFNNDLKVYENYMKDRLIYIKNTLSELRGLQVNTKDGLEDFFSIKEAKFAPVFEYKEVPQETLDSFEPIFENIIDEIKNILVEKCLVNNQYIEIYNNMKNELGNEKCNFIGEDVLKTLATGEYLFNTFVIGNSSTNNLKDFSCISIMYYKALEAILNKKIYRPYKQILMNDGLDKCINNETSSHVRKYLPKDAYKFYEKSKLKKELTLGNFAFLFKEIEDETKFQDFLNGKLKNGIDIQVLKDYGNELYSISSNRNYAAHGNKIITFSRVKEDKKNIYVNSSESYLDDAKQYKMLLIKLLDFFDINLR